MKRNRNETEIDYVFLLNFDIYISWLCLYRKVSIQLSWSYLCSKTAVIRNILVYIRNISEILLILFFSICMKYITSQSNFCKKTANIAHRGDVCLCTTVAKHWIQIFFETLDHYYNRGICDNHNNEICTAYNSTFVFKNTSTLTTNKDFIVRVYRFDPSCLIWNITFITLMVYETHNGSCTFLRNVFCV